MLYKNKFFLCRIRKNLIIGFSKRAGRNFFGRKTILTQSGGVFNKNYIIDFKRNLQYNAILLTIHKDVNRTGLIGLICYENGLHSYILLSSDHIETGIGKIIYGFLNKLKKNSSTFLLNIPTGNFIHHIENIPNRGAVLSRAAGCSSFVISKDNIYTHLKMNSGWFLKISKFCVAVLGIVSNESHHITRVKNAGKNRKMGWRPKVRGVSMNPCDHPHGGGEGRGSPPAAHRTPWGKLTKVPTKRTKRHLLKKKLFKKFYV